MKKNILLFLISFALFFPKSIHATSYGLSISPPLLRVQIKPGKSITQVFKIENLSPTDRFLIVRVVPFSESDSHGNPLLNLKSPTNWLNYFSLSNSNIKLDEPFTIRANSSEQLILSLSIPETASLKDLYATLLISTYNNALDIGYQGTAVSASIGSNLLITVSSTLNPDTLLQIKNLQLIDGAFLKIGNYYLADNITPLRFSASVTNIGDFIAETKGIFKITDRHDKPLYLDGLLPVYVITKNNRILLNNQGNNFQYLPGLGQVGLHHATIEIKTDNSNTTSSLSIIFIPFKISLGLLFSLFPLRVILKATNKSNIT